MRIAAVMGIRNEADVIAANVAFHRAAGVDDFWIVDNGSTDGTRRVLKKLAKTDPNIRWRKDDGAFRPGEIATELAHEATRAGADWIVPIDADEFFQSSRPLREAFADTDAGALKCEVVTFVQARTVQKQAADALLTMTFRPSQPVERREAKPLILENRLGFVESQYVPKWISRASTALLIHHGNHEVEHVDGAVVDSVEIVCLHAPLRSRETLINKVVQGRRAAAAESPLNQPEQSWHVKRWAEIAERQGDAGLDAEWAANSYEDGCLDVYGEKHRLTSDRRLRDALAPHIRS